MHRALPACAECWEGCRCWGWAGGWPISEQVLQGLLGPTLAAGGGGVMSSGRLLPALAGACTGSAEVEMVALLVKGTPLTIRRAAGRDPLWRAIKPLASVLRGPAFCHQHNYMHRLVHGQIAVNQADRMQTIQRTEASSAVWLRT